MSEYKDSDFVKVIEEPTKRVLFWGRFLDLAPDKVDWVVQNMVKEGDIYVAHKQKGGI